MQLTSYLDYGYDMNVRKNLSFGSGSRFFSGVTLGSKRWCRLYERLKCQIDRKIDMMIMITTQRWCDCQLNKNVDTYIYSNGIGQTDDTKTHFVSTLKRCNSRCLSRGLGEQFKKTNFVCSFVSISCLVSSLECWSIKINCIFREESFVLTTQCRNYWITPANIPGGWIRYRQSTKTTMIGSM